MYNRFYRRYHRLVSSIVAEERTDCCPCSPEHQVSGKPREFDGPLANQIPIKLYRTREWEVSILDHHLNRNKIRSPIILCEVLGDAHKNNCNFVSGSLGGAGPNSLWWGRRRRRTILAVSVVTSESARQVDNIRRSGNIATLNALRAGFRITNPVNRNLLYGKQGMKLLT
ncbi:hypothetical protein WA026_019729 [Henosepilachna vigintioctopunctata]|uniref:Ribosomal protein S11 n=1 Tax=Henosepilachna vigintioctopunctata TaxID=420089 RepID=A0AAW1UN38_9CUCU